jgi:superfamily I DNA/RNA helicase
MKIWLVHRTELSPEQRRAVELHTQEHWVIGGAPGSGKTQILLHRARHLLDEYGTDPARLRIFIFTNVLKGYIRSALGLLKLSESCVSTFDAWCCDYYQTHISRSLPWSHAEKTRDYLAIRKAVLDRVRTLPIERRLFDFILVDEGQDLEPISFEILKAVARHVTVCIDHKQQIYDHGSSEAQILQSLGLKRRNFTLLAAFRCSPYIVELAAQFIPGAQERSEFIKQNRVPMTEKETPLLYRAESWEEERSRLIEVIKTRQIKGDKIAVLFPSKQKVYGFAQGFTDAGLVVEVRREAWQKNVRYPDLDFSSDLPKLMTYHSAKGLTFDTVMLPRLVRGSFRRSSIPVSNLLFVGVTRATRWAFLSTERGKEVEGLDQLHALHAGNKLAIQSKNDRFQTKHASPPKCDHDAEDDEDIGDLI